MTSAKDQPDKRQDKTKYASPNHGPFPKDEETRDDSRAAAFKSKLSLPTDLPEYIGPFKILDLLGEGGMGRVFLGEQPPPLSRKVAVKVIRSEYAGVETINRFRAEQYSLGLMDHPSIAKVHEAGTATDGTPYFAMAYVDGPTLHEYADQMRLDIQERTDLFLQVCQGIRHAHQKGVIHRDIKPSNILVDTEEGKAHPVVIDFGIAKALTPEAGKFHGTTRQGSWVGTPSYMSPEQASGEPVDVRSDVYSLCMIFYELLCGRLPFSEETTSGSMFQILSAVTQGEKPRPSATFQKKSKRVAEIASRRSTSSSKLQKELKTELDWIILKGLSIDPNDRYDSVDALIDDLERYRRHEPIRARREPPMMRFKKFLWRHKFGTALSALALASIVAGTIGISIGLVRAKRAEANALREAEATRRVTDFVIDLFRLADPGEARGNSVTVREVLDSGAKDLHEGLQEDPEVRGQMMYAIGRVYYNLGLYEESLDLMETAVKLAEEGNRNKGSDTVLYLEGLAGVYRALAKFQAGEASLKRALVLAQNAAPPDPVQIAVIKDTLATLYFDWRRYEDAEPLYREALAIREKELGEFHRRTAMTLNGLGITLSSLDRNDEALPYLQRATQIRRQILPPDHPDVAQSFSNLGAFYKDRNRLDEAEPLLKEASEIWGKILGQDNVRQAISLFNLGDLYLKQKAYDKAEASLNRSMQIFQNKLGENHPNVSYPLQVLAEVYEQQGQLDKAEDNYRKSLAIRERAYGSEAEIVVSTREKLDVVLEKRKKEGAPEG